MIQEKKKARNSGVEFLRILCLVLIFWMHASGSYSNNELSAWICIAVNAVGNIGVSCFILISGYYGIRLDVKKMIKLDLMLIFYAWTALALQIAWGYEIGGADMLTYIFPVIGRYSWYFTCYFALAYLSPFLNELTEKLERKRFGQLLATMLIIFSGVTTFFFFDITQDGGKGIVNMVLLYLIGRYLRLYHEDTVFAKKKLTGIFLAVALANFALNGLLYVVTGTMQNRFARDNTLFIITEAVCVFLLFRGRHFENRAVNAVAGAVPAIFMMERIMRGIITEYFFDYLAWRETNWHEWILLGISLLLIAMGFVIEQLRRLVFGKVEDAVVPLLYERIKSAGEKLAARAQKRMERR